VTINGREMSYPQQPVNRNGSILVPLRSIFESLGADVAYDPATRTIQGKSGETTMTLRIGSTAAQRDGKALTLAEPPALIGNSVFVPLRFIGESLGADVAWEAATRVIRIRTKVTEALLNEMETLPLSNDIGEPLTLLHDGKVKLRWWLQDDSPYQNWQGFVAPDDRLIALGYSEWMALDLQSGKRLVEGPRTEQEGLHSAEAVKGDHGYVVTINEDDRAWSWDGVPLEIGPNAESFITVDGEPSPDFLRVTAVLDRERRLIVPTENGLAAYDLEGKLAWLHKEWAIPEGAISAHDPIVSIATDASNRIYLSFDEGFVVLDEKGHTLTALPHWFVPIVLEDGTLLEGGGSYRIEDGQLVEVQQLHLGDRSIYATGRADGTMKRVEAATGETVWEYGLGAEDFGRGYGFERWVVDGENNVYLGTNGGSVHALDRNGNLRFILTVNNRTHSRADVLPLSTKEFLVIEGNKIMCFDIKP
jgi:outer membrane protein assembly factor BamB